jgi:hypothetical protein
MESATDVVLEVAQFCLRAWDCKLCYGLATLYRYTEHCCHQSMHVARSPPLFRLSKQCDLFNSFSQIMTGGVREVTGASPHVFFSFAAQACVQLMAACS